MERNFRGCGYGERGGRMEQVKTGAFIFATAVVIFCFVFFYILEKKNTSVRKIMLITVLTTMSIAGRFIFAPFPGFKPVTAVVIIAGMYLGIEAGFYCGALTALITNFYFGQGMYTPFQMLTWGLIGIISALIGGLLRKNKAVLMIYGVFAGVIFSLLMDIYTVIWTFGTFRWSYYLITISTSLTFTIIYAVSNIIFLLALAVPLGKKIEHAYKKRV